MKLLLSIEFNEELTSDEPYNKDNKSNKLFNYILHLLSF